MAGFERLYKTVMNLKKKCRKLGGKYLPRHSNKTKPDIIYAYKLSRNSIFGDAYTQKYARDALKADKWSGTEAEDQMR